MRRGLYYSYTITSQSYSAARPISGSNGLNELDAAAESVDAITDITTDAIIDAEYYTGSDFFYTTNYHQWLSHSGSYTKYKILFSLIITEYSISFSFISSSFIL
jgi:hypothetical protein